MRERWRLEKLLNHLVAVLLTVTWCVFPILAIKAPRRRSRRRRRRRRRVGAFYKCIHVSFVIGAIVV